MGKRFTYKHNDIERLEKNLIRASKVASSNDGGILVISEGVFGMRGEQGKLREIVGLKDKYKFRFLVDDAHGFGTLGKNGSGTGDEQGIQDEIEAAWDPTFGDRKTEIVIIGQNLDEAQIRQELDACLVPLDRLHENWQSGFQDEWPVERNVPL